MKISLNGVLRDADDGRIDPRDRGFTLSDGVFETIAVRKGKMPRLPAHLARLREGLSVIGLALLADDQDLTVAIADLLLANKMTDAVVRLTVSRGIGARGIVPPDPANPTVVIATSPMPPPADPARVIVDTATRRNEYSPLSRIKSLSYLDNVLARQDAMRHGVDDALMLNTAGHIACATVGNVFLLFDGGLITPPVRDGAMPGIARAEVMALTRAEERRVTIDMLPEAAEVFITNVLGVRPVIAIDGRPVGDGEPGLITQLVATRV